MTYLLKLTEDEARIITPAFLRGIKGSHAVDLSNAPGNGVHTLTVKLLELTSTIMQETQPL